MSLDKITDYSTTPADNVDVGNVAITGASSIRLGNDAIQTMMSHLAKVNAGTDPVADTWTFADPADLTKRFRFDGGNISAGSTRTIVVPNGSGTLVFEAQSQILTNKTLTTPTLTLKQSADPTPTAEGDIQWDTDDNTIKIGDGSGTKTFYPNGWTTLTTVTVSNQAAISITNIPASALMVEIEFINVTPVTDSVNLVMRTSTNNGSSYDNGGSDYNYTQLRSVIGASPTQVGSAADSGIILSSGIGNAAAEYVSGTIKLRRPGAAARLSISYQMEGMDPSGSPWVTVGGARRLTAADVDAVQFTLSSGNFNSGTVVARYFV